MEEPARKKRKTTSPNGQDTLSPLKQPPRRPSLAARSLAAAERRSSPLKERPRRFSISPTKGGIHESSSPLKQPPRRPLRRPSFASPTKSSLARDYPDLLRQPSSGRPSINGHGNDFARGQQALAYVLGDKRQGTQIDPAAQEENEFADDSVAGAQSPIGTRPAPDSTPRARRTRTAVADHVTHDAMDEDMDLPTTPSQGLSGEQHTPRPGMFSSPSRRPPRLKHAVGHSPLQKSTPLSKERILVRQNEATRKARSKSPKAQQDKMQPPDPRVEEKKREKARLQRELDDLEKQITGCTRELVKFQAQPLDHHYSSREREDLVTLINKVSGLGDRTDEDGPLLISNLLASFLPFSTLATVPPKSKSESPVASHRPVELENPLPYLGMFSSFRFSTKLQLTHGRGRSSPDQMLQKHIIEITGPQKLLSSAISVTIDTLTSTIVDLQAFHLSVWAERELGSFLRLREEDKNLGNACWAIGSYWDLAKKRAEYQYRCEVAFGYLTPGRTREDTENHNHSTASASKQGPPRKDLNRHLGRDILVLEDRHVLLKITWRIVFDWTGEAQSEVGAVVAVPRVWNEGGGNDAFKKIPETFTSLMQAKGVFAATKTMVALLFSD